MELFSLLDLLRIVYFSFSVLNLTSIGLCFPSSLGLPSRGACIVPLYKGKGDKCKCSNSRGISSLSVVGKLFGAD